MRLAAAFVQRAHRQAKADETRAAEARAAEKTAALTRVVAEEKARASKVAAAALAPLQKKRKTASGSAVGADDGASSGGLLEVQGRDSEEEATEEEPTWKTWSLARWRKHEAEIQARRSVLIDINNTDTSLPPRGNEERGWRKHWRRGLVGSLQDWAEGSTFRVAFMLAEMARHFEVQQQVCIPYTSSILHLVGDVTACQLPRPPFPLFDSCKLIANVTTQVERCMLGRWHCSWELG